jgi:hypothetical protein
MKQMTISSIAVDFEKECVQNKRPGHPSKEWKKQNKNKEYK